MRNKGKRQAKGKLAEVQSEWAPTSVSMAAGIGTSTTSYRRNRAASDERPDRFANIEDALIPFKYAQNGVESKSNMTVKDAVVLCQKCYYNFAIFRNTIDLMTEFSTSQIFLKGGSKKSRDFFLALFRKINLLSLQDKFFREYYRSGNVFIYRFDGEVQPEDLTKITQTFGADKSKTAKDLTLPVRYVILNPSEIQVGGNISFAAAQYYKVLSDYELERLKKPRTDEDKQVYDNLPSEVKSDIKTKKQIVVLLPLDMRQTVAVFYKKQDYEPFAVPMGFPVLEDINWKAEMKKMDMAVTRTMQQVILLITLGESPKDGGMGVNQKHIEAMQKFFENESVARVLIADYTTKATFVVPDIANLIDPKKYAQVDKDIKEGLNQVLIGSDDKFANASVKIDIFVERLRQAREAFINDFLLQEIKRVAQDVGLKNYPTPYFEDIELKDSLEYSKIYSRLVELGVLTPLEALEAIDTGKLPSSEESQENQAELRKLKDKGYYEPIVGGPFSQQKMQNDGFKNQQEMADIQHQHDSKMKTKELRHKAENPEPVQPQIVINGQPGRPSGTKSKNKTKKPARVGGSEETLEGYSLKKIKQNLTLSQVIHNEVANALKAKHAISELDEKQQEVADQIAEVIIANETPSEWVSKVNAYIDNPIDTNPERISEIQDVAFEHGLDTFLASILYWSKG
jgi:hypothetical protein